MATTHVTMSTHRRAIKALEDRIGRLLQDNKIITDTASNAARERESLREERDGAYEINKRLGESVTRLCTEKDVLLTQRNSFDAEIVSLRQQLKDVTLYVEQLQESRDEFERGYNVLKGSYAELSQQCSTLRSQLAASEREAAKDGHAALILRNIIVEALERRK
jgi:chromosome segregation ATPase